MEIIIYIILGLFALAIAVFLLKVLLMLCGPALILGGLTWLIFDSFWLGCIIGGIITLILILKDPEGFFSDIINEASKSSSSGGSSSSSKEYIKDKWGNQREVTYRDSNSMYDDYGNRYRSDDGGSTWYQDD